MIRAGITATFVSLLLFGSAAAAEGRIDHFEGKPAATLGQAVVNFTSENKRLRELVGKKELSAQDLTTIHELTYTLEIALARINAEMSTLSQTLESLHKSSERLDGDAARKHGEAYLNTIHTVFP